MIFLSQTYIREASIDDCKNISEIHVRSWLETYDGIIPPSFLSKISVSERENTWVNNFKKEELSIFVAISGNDIIGFSSIAPRIYKGSHVIFLESIYLLKSFQNQGVGKELFYKALCRAKEYGYSSIFIEVLADNPTLNFYLRYSANMIEENIIKLGDENLLEYILRIDFTD